MLIAIMGQTFSRVSDTTQAAILRERLQLIIENFFVPSVKFKHFIRYLISIESIKDEKT